MKLQNSNSTFLLILFEVYGVFSAAIEPTLVLTSDFQELLMKCQILRRGDQSLQSSFSFKQNSSRNSSCRHPWVFVGRSCLFTDLSKSTTWMEGRNFCKEFHKGSDLAIFRDANELAEIIRHLRTINSANKEIDFWMGGSDLGHSNDWRWITGEPIPMDSPFWGRGEPNDNDEHCVMLYKYKGYCLNDLRCEGESARHTAPLCQYNPIVF